jgi:hypothetical protein
MQIRQRVRIVPAQRSAVNSECTDSPFTNSQSRDRIMAVFNRMKGGDREKAPD